MVLYSFGIRSPPFLRSVINFLIDLAGYLLEGFPYLIGVSIFEASDLLPYRQGNQSLNIHSAGESGLRLLIVLDDQKHHVMLFFQRGVGVHLVEGILMQKVFTDGARRFQLQPVGRRKGIHTYELYNFFQFCLILQQAHKLCTQLYPVRGHIGIEPFFHGVEIKGIAGEPVDGRKMPLVGQ